MAAKVNLNADIAEGFGAYDIGNDAAMMDIVKSANVACGMHAGDANTMHRLVMLARDKGVSIGAHPGFNDLWGFGRRQIRMSPTELEYLVAYQIGALQGMAAYGGLKVTHLKTHGALSNMACVEADYAMAIGRAIKTIDPGMIFVVLFAVSAVKAGYGIFRIAAPGTSAVIPISETAERERGVADLLSGLALAGASWWLLQMHRRLAATWRGEPSSTPAAPPPPAA